MANDKLKQVHIAPKVLECMKRGALLYPKDETGEALVGVMLHPEGKSASFPTMYVLETIAPVENVIRSWGMVEQGDDWQAAIFNWLNKNWELYRELRRRSYGKAISAKWDLPLLQLGDWHKQPGMVVPSMGDFHTAKDIVNDKDNGLEYLLTPIVTLTDEATAPIETNTLILDETLPSVRVDFWGISRKSKDFIPLEPVPSLNYGLPRLPEIAWWLKDEERLEQEITALEKGSLDVKGVTIYNVDGMPSLETCFIIYQPGANHVILAITSYAYPQHPPEWRLASLKGQQEGRRWIEILLEASKPIPKSITKEWSGHSHALIDGVRMIQQAMQEKKL